MIVAQWFREVYSRTIDREGYTRFSTVCWPEFTSNLGVTAMKSTRGVLWTLAVCGPFFGPISVWGQTAATTRPAADAAAAESVMKLAKFELKHCQPGELQTALQSIITELSKQNSKRKF